MLHLQKSDVNGGYHHGAFYCLFQSINIAKSMDFLLIGVNAIYF